MLFRLVLLCAVASLGCGPNELEEGPKCGRASGTFDFTFTRTVIADDPACEGFPESFTEAYAFSGDGELVIAEQDCDTQYTPGTCRVDISCSQTFPSGSSMLVEYVLTLTTTGRDIGGSVEVTGIGGGCPLQRYSVAGTKR